MQWIREGKEFEGEGKIAIFYALSFPIRIHCVCLEFPMHTAILSYV
jgi:hypothetical protein